MRHNYIGEIKTKGEVNLPSLSCEMINDAEMGLILCDELGKTHYEKSFKLKRGANNLNLNLPDLKKGKYNAWIEIQGKTFLRKLHIEKEVSKSFLSIFDKLRKRS